jgi:kumamolisin
MATSSKRAIIAGSHKKPLYGAKAVGKVNPAELITVTVLLRRRASAEPAVVSDEAELRLSRAEFAAQRGADPADVAALEAFAHDHGLSVGEVNLCARSVKLTGTIAALSAAFRCPLKIYKVGTQKFRGRTGSLSAPANVARLIEGVFGLDNRPAARAHFRQRVFARPGRGATGTSGSGAGKMRPRNAADGSLTAPQIAALYDFPQGLDGTGQCIAILELGGGYTQADLKKYFSGLKLPNPAIVAVAVDNAHNAPGGSADGEVLLDIQVAGAVAPKAKLAVYFAPNTDQGFLDALLGAVHDAQRKPSVVSISWGAPEDVAWTDQARKAFDGALQDAATLGVTVCCAAGDDGSSDIRSASQRDGKPHCDFPASSPFALACGGTKLNGSGTRIASEVVWNEGNSGGATGGGVSVVFPKPGYQSSIAVPPAPQGGTGRGVPDVAGNADPATGYRVVIHGAWTTIGGTSAVAPLWAGLIALLNQRMSAVGKPHVGSIHSAIYAHPGVFRDITTGNNDVDGTLRKYTARAGWDACTGLGSPIGSKLLGLF